MVSAFSKLRARNGSWLSFSLFELGASIGSRLSFVTSSIAERVLAILTDHSALVTQCAANLEILILSHKPVRRTA